MTRNTTTNAKTMGNSETQKLRTLQDSIEALPDPSTVWSWSDGLDAVGPSELEKLKAAGAVERVSSDWWRVPPRIAAYVHRVYGTEPSGSKGQDTLPVGRLVPAMDRADTGIDKKRGRQVTLDGGPVTIDVHDRTGDGDGETHPSECSGQLDVRAAIEIARGS